MSQRPRKHPMLVAALIAATVAGLALIVAGNGRAETAVPDDYPRSLEREVSALRAAKAQDSTNPDTIIHMAGLYLDMGDNLFNDTASRLSAYEEGARLAKRALELREDSAFAHFYYAANLGSAAQLKGLVASAFTVRELKAHTARAIELRKDYPQALHMMGMMLTELPRLLGGDPEEGLKAIERAVAIDPEFTHARLDLAKLYLKRKNHTAARRQLEAIVNMSHPRDSYAWAQRDKPAAIELLRQLPAAKAPPQ